LIQPLDPAKLQQWLLCQSLARTGKAQSQGHLDPQGKVWAAPIAGVTVIAYNRDKFKSLDWTPSDWVICGERNYSHFFT